MKRPEVIAISEKIVSRRHYLNLKQEDVAEMAGVTVKTLYQVEQGKGNPSLATLVKILQVLGLMLSLEIKSIGDERIGLQQ